MTSSTRNFLLGKGLADLRPDNEFIFLLHSGLLLKFFELRIRCALTWSKWKISCMCVCVCVCVCMCLYV